MHFISQLSKFMSARLDRRDASWESLLNFRISLATYLQYGEAANSFYHEPHTHNFSVDKPLKMGFSALHRKKMFVTLGFPDNMSSLSDAEVSSVLRQWGKAAHSS